MHKEATLNACVYYHALQIPKIQEILSCSRQIPARTLIQPRRAPLL